MASTSSMNKSGGWVNSSGHARLGARVDLQNANEMTRRFARILPSEYNVIDKPGHKADGWYSLKLEGLFFDVGAVAEMLNSAFNEEEGRIIKFGAQEGRYEARSLVVVAEKPEHVIDKARSLREIILQEEAGNKGRA